MKTCRWALVNKQQFWCHCISGGHVTSGYCTVDVAFDRSAAHCKVFHPLPTGQFQPHRQFVNWGLRESFWKNLILDLDLQCQNSKSFISWDNLPEKQTLQFWTTLLCVDPQWTRKFTGVVDSRSRDTTSKTSFVRNCATSVAYRLHEQLFATQVHSNLHHC